MLFRSLEGPALLAAWISAGFAHSASGIISVIAVAYFLSSLTNLPVVVAMSFGLPQLISKYSIIRMVITIITMYPLVRYHGLTGAAWVLLLSELQALALIYETSRRIFGINIYRTLFRPLLTHAVVSTAILLGYNLVYRHSAWYTPLGVVVVLVIYPILTVALGATTKTDNRRLRKLLLAWR